MLTQEPWEFFLAKVIFKDMNSHIKPDLLQQRYLPEENQNNDDDITLTRVYSSAS